MSDLSNAFHAFLDTVKSGASKAWTDAVSLFESTVTVGFTQLETAVKTAGPVVFQIVTTAVLTVATSGAPGMAPAIAAAEAALKAEGITLAEEVLHGTVAAAVANIKAAQAKVVS